MPERDIEFEWDADKAELNAKRHNGVTFQEAATVFDDFYARVMDDPDHSSDEHREIVIGQSNHNRLLIVSFTERRPYLIRIISARKPTPRERRRYEEETD